MPGGLRGARPDDRYGRLVVTSEAGRAGDHKLFLCACDCGGDVIVKGTNLRRGATRSCGCLQRELAKNRLSDANKTHGLSYHPLYWVHHAMHQRCSNPRYPRYADWGGRGIQVCARWSGLYGLTNFVADMGERPVGLTLDRRDNDGNYEPDNCQWATPKEQQANTRRSK